mmetsp:Transcript_78606/g.138568  ORF Transcript_78606/g.138568 Transcript_78606/m.138568 type:complete len:334 (+) Transcript_78606:103-1104(+)|eukprot:CAMPEP_0197659368 /NCGR_PEP_ID=MMETSP1338-20131121/47419_1 /TAXON_ID=43686 ORGANISM="Pelagodinium beii, Strain RCC1491" /NCGR_SAMPLE_ID=MMETSP1338 /ASSEMBLY_ACC=CAM_ASM_000754 /LENGTH=333 /DNA_ID=CAMNT_0043236265 /DNA_START=80 /DNA_END=1081 /DNA_ORIENTATION=-
MATDDTHKSRSVKLPNIFGGEDDDGVRRGEDIESDDENDAYPYRQWVVSMANHTLQPPIRTREELATAKWLMERAEAQKSRRRGSQIQEHLPELSHPQSSSMATPAPKKAAELPSISDAVAGKAPSAGKPQMTHLLGADDYGARRRRQQRGMRLQMFLDAPSPPQRPSDRKSSARHRQLSSNNPSDVLENDKVFAAAGQEQVLQAGLPAGWGAYQDYVNGSVLGYGSVFQLPSLGAKGLTSEPAHEGEDIGKHSGQNGFRKSKRQKEDKWLPAKQGGRSSNHSQGSDYFSKLKKNKKQPAEPHRRSEKLKKAMSRLPFSAVNELDQLRMDHLE